MSDRSEALSSVFLFSCRLILGLFLFPLQAHSYIFESDSYICSGMRRLEKRPPNCHRLALPPIGVLWNFAFFPSLHSPLDLAGPADPPRRDPCDPHHFRENRCKPRPPHPCLGDSPRLTADSEVPQRQLSWFRVTSESVLSHSDAVKESAEMNWWQMAYLYPSHLISHWPTGQEY